jgi:thiol-disulfide isomerase/thioredoxin
MTISGLEISRRAALIGATAGASALLLPKAARAETNAQAEAWKSIRLVRHDGSQFALRDVPGQVVVTALWGAFCSVCRAEIPALLRAQDDIGAKRLGLVLISHPLFWEEDLKAAARLGLTEHAATAAPDTDWDRLSTAWAMQGTSVEVPQALVYRRGSGADLSLVYRKTGGMNGELMARIRDGVG